MKYRTLTVCLGLGLVACAEPSADTAIDAVAGEGTAAEAEAGVGSPDVYEVRGEVVLLPADGDPQSELRIKHEAIDDLKGIGGEVWGMDSMTMPFALAEGVSLDGLAIGDKVRFTLAIDWLGERPQEITEIEQLPAETVLEFRPARVPNAAEDEEGSDEPAG